jgi:hypothetical protein
MAPKPMRATVRPASSALPPGAVGDVVTSVIESLPRVLADLAG